MSGERLFDFHTVDGEINRGAIATAREVAKRFRDFPPFVGITARGSISRGYSTESSDLDLVLLYDSSIPSRVVNSGLHPFYFMRMLSEGTNFFTYSRVVELKSRDINPERLNSEVPTVPADIFRVVTGSKIAQYRRLYSEFIRCLPDTERGRIIQELARDLADDDSRGWRKLAERISGVPMLDYQGEIELYYEVLKANGIDGYDEYKSKRYRLWQGRIERFCRVSDQVSDGPKELVGIVH